MSQVLHSGAEGTIHVDKLLLQLTCTMGAAGGSVVIGDQPAVDLPANSDWEFVPKQRWYDLDIVFTGTTFFFVEEGSY